MNLADILAQAGGIESMAKELGVPPGVAKQGAEAPWKVVQNYLYDIRALRRSDLDDGTLTWS